MTQPHVAHAASAVAPCFRPHYLPLTIPLAVARPRHRCNDTLYDNPRLVATLSPAALLHYFGQCWRGIWRDFVTNSFTYVCLASWLAAGFRREQFMVRASSRLSGLRFASFKITSAVHALPAWSVARPAQPSYLRSSCSHRF